MRKRAIPGTILAVAVILATLLVASSCGSGEGKGSASTTKLPPMMAGSEDHEEIPPPDLSALEEDGGAPAGGREASSDAAVESGDKASAGKTVTLSGVEFTVVAAKREDNNKLAASSATREVNGDFLEVELKIKNLNPLSVSRNQGFTKEGSNLVIYDTWTRKKAEVNLAGFPD